MSVRAGQILHVGNSFLIDRIQTAGPGNLNIPEEKIHELGNYQTVATLRDTPDLSFDLESLDMSAEIESIINAVDPATVVAGDEFKFTNAKPLDIVTPIKGQGNSFVTVRGVVLPNLILESATYRFGLRQNATESFTLRGDSIFYAQGTPYFASYTVPGVAGEGPYLFAAAPALPFTEAGVVRHALSVSLVYADGTTRRLYHGVDFTDTAADFTLLVAPAVGTVVHATYASAVPATYNQASHPLAAVKPAAIRGKDIELYVGPAGGPLIRWSGVQTVEFNWRVQLDRDEEFGNPYVVSADYDTPEVTGSVGIKASTINYLFDRIAQVTGTSAGEVAGVMTSVPLEVEARLKDPLTGAIVKTIVCPDARFQPPPIQGRVQQKLESTLPFTSDSGDMSVFSGARA